MLHGVLNTNMNVNNPSFLASSVQNPYIISNGLVGYWSFNDGSGSTIRDFSPTRNDGRAVTTPSWIPGRVGPSLNFDGSQYVILNSTGLQTVFSGGDFTISLWVYFRSITNFAGLFMCNNNGISIDDASRRYALIYADGNVATTNQGVPVTGVWHHLVGTKTTSTYKIYVNNVDATGGYYSDSGWGTTGQYWIGNGYLSQKPNGIIDDIRIYNRSLNASEIKALYTT